VVSGVLPQEQRVDQLPPSSEGGEEHMQLHIPSLTHLHDAVFHTAEGQRYCLHFSYCYKLYETWQL